MLQKHQHYIIIDIHIQTLRILIILQKYQLPAPSMATLNKHRIYICMDLVVDAVHMYMSQMRYESQYMNLLQEHTQYTIIHIYMIM